MALVGSSREECAAAGIIDAAIRVHTALGPGLLESAYEACLAYELLKRDFVVMRQVKIPIVYENLELSAAYRLDLLVDEVVIVEVKAMGGFERIHTAQLLSYLRLSRKRLGLLLNFNVLRMSQGVRRVIDVPR
jgi:GxxExxY protein